MKLKIFLLSLSISFCAFTFSNNCSTDNESTSTFSQSAQSFGSFYAETTYERVKIDGLWWIIVYEDGVKTQQYVDPDQS